MDIGISGLVHGSAKGFKVCRQEKHKMHSDKRVCVLVKFNDFTYLTIKTFSVKMWVVCACV